MGDSAADVAAGALLAADVAFEPDRINAGSNGNFVTAWLGFPDDVDPAELRVETAMLGMAGAVTDDQYGFVTEPPVEERADGQRVMVKFPREEVVRELGTGRHEVTVTGAVGNVSFRATAELEVFQPGNGNGNGGGNEGNRGNEGRNK